MSDPARGIAFALMAVSLFSVQDGVSRHLAAHYPVPFFVMIRYWFFAAFVVAVSARSEGGLSAAMRSRMPLLQAVRGLLLAAQILVIVSSFDLIGLGPTHAIFALYPLIATALAVPVLGETVGWRRWAAVAVGFLGVLVILRPGLGAFDLNALVAVTAAAMFAVYAVLTRLVGRVEGEAGPAFLYTGLGGAALMTLVGPFHWAQITPADWGWTLLLCITGMGGHYCLIRALAATEAVRVQPFVYLQMVLGTLVGWAVFGERLDPWMLLGMGLIVGAGLYAIRREMAAMARTR